MSRKFTIEEVEVSFSNRGFTLLADKYPHARFPLECMCSLGHKIKLCLNSLKNGTGCSVCKGNARLTHAYVSEYFQKHDCRLLSYYENSTQLLDYVCSCGRNSKIKWGDFQRGKRCRECYRTERVSRGLDHPRWIPDRERVALLQKVSDAAHSALKTTLTCLGKRKNGKTKRILGYTYEELLVHLESHPDWEELKRSRWSVDHIFPIKAFVDHGITDVALINSLQNLQPMLLSDNCSKNDAYDPEDFGKWIKERTDAHIQGNRHDNVEV